MYTTTNEQISLDIIKETNKRILNERYNNIKIVSESDKPDVIVHSNTLEPSISMAVAFLMINGAPNELHVARLSSDIPASYKGIMIDEAQSFEALWDKLGISYLKKVYGDEPEGFVMMINRLFCENLISVVNEEREKFMENGGYLQKKICELISNENVTESEFIKDVKVSADVMTWYLTEAAVKAYLYLDFRNGVEKKQNHFIVLENSEASEFFDPISSETEDVWYLIFPQYGDYFIEAVTNGTSGVRHAFPSSWKELIDNDDFEEVVAARGAYHSWKMCSAETLEDAERVAEAAVKSAIEVDEVV